MRIERNTEKREKTVKKYGSGKISKQTSKPYNIVKIYTTCFLFSHFVAINIEADHIKVLIKGESLA